MAQRLRRGGLLEKVDQSPVRLGRQIGAGNRLLDHVSGEANALAQRPAVEFGVTGQPRTLVPGQPAVAEAVRQAFGRLDVLFVNAGVAAYRPVEKWDEAGFDRSIAIILKGPFFLVQALLPILANPASIVLNTSITDRIGLPNTSVYAAAKAALRSLARTLSAELISRGVRVNAVSPGLISTPLHGKLGLTEADLKARVVSFQIPAKRFGNPIEIAQAVVFLASDEAAFTVGNEFVIDGGMSNL